MSTVGDILSTVGGGGAILSTVGGKIFCYLAL